MAQSENGASGDHGAAGLPSGLTADVRTLIEMMARGGIAELSLATAAVKLRLRESAPSGRGRPSRVRRVQSCLSRDLKLAVYGRERRLVERAGYYVDHRRVASTRRPPFGVEVQRHRLPARRTVTVRARITTIDGRVITRDRALRTCR